ncbi:MAG: hypothetical protein ACE5GK_09635 [Nitrospiria bacterium]
MPESATQKTLRAPRSAPYDLVVFGIVMIVSGVFDIYIILDNPEYRLTVLGRKLDGPVIRYFIFLFPIFHFVVGYGVIMCRRWAYYLFMAFAVYGIISPLINYFRFPPPHRVRTILLIGSLFVMAYLYWRRRYFKA